MTSPSPATLAHRFTHGLRLPLIAGRRLLTTPRWWPYVIAPAALTLLLLAGALWLTLRYATPLTLALFAEPTGTGALATLLAILWTVAHVLLHLLLFLTLAIVSWFLSGVLASPLHDQLSWVVERDALGACPDDAGGLREAAGDVALGVAHSAMGLALYVAVWIPLALLHGIPVVGQLLYVLAATTLSALFLAREVLDYSLSRQRLGFARKLARIVTHLPECLGLGLALLALLAIPALNLLSMPIGVIAGTLLCASQPSLRPPIPKSTHDS